MTMALGTAIITEAFPPSERGSALGISGTIVSVGIAIGPTLGGLILQNLTWHWIFFVNLPIGILGTWMVTRYVPVSLPRQGQRFDFGGAATFFVALLSLLFALTFGQDMGFSAPLVLGLFALSGIFLAAFITLELRMAQPMLDLRLFKNDLFAVNVATGTLVFICMAGTMILMPFYLQDILGYKPEQAGLLLSVVPIALGLTSPISGRMSDRFGPRLIAAAGLLFLVFGYFLLTTLDTATTALGYALRFLPVGLGIGIFQSPNNSAIMGSSPRENLGVVSSLLAVNRTTGQTTGIAVLGALWAARVFSYEGSFLPGGATSASVASQVSAMHDIFYVTTGLVIFALGLSLWALYRETSTRQSRSEA